MAVVHPFRGIRYNLKAVRDLSLVVTQPYDRIGPREMEAYLKRSPYNFVRLIGGKTPPQDEGDYARRAELFQAWLRKRILLQDPRPGIYVYHTHFTHDGERFVRQGLIALLDLQESRAKAHERTLRGPKEDRLKLFRATEAHLEHIFLLYRDPERRATRAVEQAIAGRAPDMEARDDFGNAHLVWYIPDEKAIQTVQETLAPLDLYIADGHHRFETARAFMQECLDRGWRPVGPESFTALPVTLVNAAEPGCVIRPTPRVVHSLPGFDLDRFLTDVASGFRVDPIGSLAEAKQRLRAGLGRNVFVAYAGRRFWALSLRPDADLDELVPGDRSPAWKRLDVAILHKAILERWLGIDEEALARQTNVDYTHTAEEAVAAVDEGHGQIAFLLNPTRVEEVMALADHGEPMPQKSTDFYPKLLSGLVAMKMEIEKP
ncbi:MAG: DUF1015 domain-containing protein [Candidatus Acetothermia bacterium]|nr:DUF1015 domain-containing protein [Candidatus Acetothermia bacterium]